MTGETMVLLVAGAAVGVAATVTMDVLAQVAGRFGLVAGADGRWVGRWYLGIFRGRFRHSDIAAAPEQPGEHRAALIGHYIIGVVLAVFYVGSARCLGFSPGAFLVAVGYGLGTCVFPWFLVYPALGYGAFGLKGPPGMKPILSSLMNHLFYGFGLWWAAGLLGLG
jgi:hypothetical protein